MCLNILAIIIAPINAVEVTIRVGTMISVGFLQPLAARIAITVAGINWKPAVFIAKSVHIESDALSLSLFNSCMPEIAFIPIGVAALASPSALAEKFIATSPIILLSDGISGKINFAIGRNNLDKNSTSPDFSAIFIIPSQKVIIPKSVSAIFTDNWTPERIALTTSLKVEFNAPKIIENTIRKYQI